MKIGFGDRIRTVPSVFSKEAFERMARLRAFGPGGWRLQALLAGGIAVLMFAGAIALFAAAAKQIYLDAYGLEAVGKVTDVSHHTNSYGNKTRWEVINYEFATATGETIEGKLDRPVSELSGLPDRNHFTVLYWERFPSVSSPRGVQRNAAILLAPMFLLFGAYFTLWWVRIQAWRRTLVADPAKI